MNQVQQLYHYRKSLSTKVFTARGWKVKRCQQCMVEESACICQYQKFSQTDAGFILLMTDREVLKPSNTGKLIADVVENTKAFLWQRTEVSDELLALLADKSRQPILVFPTSYAVPEQRVEQRCNINTATKPPLFIILDASWREARRMYRKSPYLHHLPMVDVNFNDIEQASGSRYQLRSSANDEQLATAEVAARMLALFGEEKTAKHLDLWFDVFVYQYQKSVCQRNSGNPEALTKFQHFMQLST